MEQEINCKCVLLPCGMSLLPQWYVTVTPRSVCLYYTRGVSLLPVFVSLLPLQYVTVLVSLLCSVIHVSVTKLIY